MSNDPQSESDALLPKTTVIFSKDDPENPRNWSSTRKWTIVASLTLVDLSVSWGASGFSPATADFEKSFNVCSQIGVLGLSLYVLGLAFGPLTIAPLSEYYGRTPLYVVPYGLYLLFLLGTALVQTLAGFLVLRFLSGFFCSVTIANFGGTIADLWPRHQVGPAMSAFVWAAVGGSPSGYFLLSFVAGTRGWREVFWALLGICGGFWLIMSIVLVAFNNETRHSVILRRRAARLRQARNTSSIDVPKEMKQKSLSQLVKVTLCRPFRFLTTELIVVLAALYNGYLYGLSFMFNGALNLVFGDEGYGFGVIGVGLSFLGFTIGVTLGPLINVWQERRYQQQVRKATKDSGSDDNSREDGHLKNIPEARLQLGQVAAVLFPASLIWFALTSEDHSIHWIIPILATTLFGFSFYTLILMAYLYVEDSYMVFSASALAGVGLTKNLAGAVFPLFGNKMYQNLGYSRAGTILACLALVLAPIPFVLDKYGKNIRARSPYARQHMDDDDLGIDENDNY